MNTFSEIAEQRSELQLLETAARRIINTEAFKISKFEAAWNACLYAQEELKALEFAELQFFNQGV